MLGLEDTRSLPAQTYTFPERGTQTLASQVLFTRLAGRHAAIAALVNLRGDVPPHWLCLFHTWRTIGWMLQSLLGESLHGWQLVGALEQLSE